MCEGGECGGRGWAGMQHPLVYIDRAGDRTDSGKSVLDSVVTKYLYEFLERILSN